MSKRALVTTVTFVVVVGIIGVALFFHGHALWNALLVMHGHRPR